MARLIEPDLSVVLAVGVVVLGIVVGTAVGWLAGLAARGRAQSEVKLLTVTEAAAAAVVFAELFWVFYKQVITSITWPSAKQRIRSRRSMWSPARAGRRRGDHPAVGDLHRRGAGGVRGAALGLHQPDPAGPWYAGRVAEIPTPPG